MMRGSFDPHLMRGSVDPRTLNDTQKVGGKNAKKAHETSEGKGSRDPRVQK